jgi:hypothetical protein
MVFCPPLKRGRSPREPRSLPGGGAPECSGGKLGFSPAHSFFKSAPNSKSAQPSSSSALAHFSHTLYQSSLTLSYVPPTQPSLNSAHSQLSHCSKKTLKPNKLSTIRLFTKPSINISQWRATPSKPLNPETISLTFSKKKDELIKIVKRTELRKHMAGLVEQRAELG